MVMQVDQCGFAVSLITGYISIFRNTFILLIPIPRKHKLIRRKRFSYRGRKQLELIGLVILEKHGRESIRLAAMWKIPR
jgi:hypothetical protein